MAGAKLSMVVRRTRVDIGGVLLAGSRRAQEEIKVAVRTALELHRGLTVGLCPVDTGRMASNTRVDIAEDEYSGTVGWHAADFTAEDQPFYPPYVVFGTRRQAARDCLTPPTVEVQRWLVADVTRILTSAWA